MSLFKKKAPKYTPPPLPPTPTEEPQQQNGVDNNNGTQKSQLVFHCQQAHGSPLGLISGFSNVKELYQKIAECYDFPADDVSIWNYKPVILDSLVWLTKLRSAINVIALLTCFTARISLIKQSVVSSIS